MAGTLAGRLIAVTRPAAQAVALAEAIRARGGEVLIQPLIRIVPVGDSPELSALRDRLDDFDLAFFVSPNAVEHGLAAILAHRPWPRRLTVATVGEGSRRQLAAHGFPAAIAPSDGADSEAVLRLPEFAPDALAGRRLVIFRGDGGRELLADTVRARGAEVLSVTCYRRLPPEGDGAALLAAAGAGRLDALTLTSSEALTNLVTLIGAAGVDRLAAVPVFAPHARIAQRAREAGFANVTVTSAGDSGLLAALDAHFGRLG